MNSGHFWSWKVQIISIVQVLLYDCIIALIKKYFIITLF